jgi:hypothetical protein
MNDYRKLNDITGATKNELDKYYVYALYKEGERLPFYIGKGEGNRLTSHIDEALRITEQKDDKKFNNKIDTIRKNHDKVKPVIIKFGLTEHEAFMTESALINLVNYSEQDTELTNLVNGHASKREQTTVSKDGYIKARTLENFIDNYALSDFDFSKIKERCILIKINSRFQTEDSDEDIYHNVRGVWKIAEYRKNTVKYALALYRGICVGIYRIQGWKRAFEHSKQYPFPTRKDGGDEATIVSYSDISFLKKEKPELFQVYFSKTEFPQKKLDNWRNRSFFYGRSDSSDVPENLKECLNKRIINVPDKSKNGKTSKSIDSRSPIIYNDVD